MILQDDELSFSRRCVTEERARFVAAAADVFNRAVERAGIGTGDVTLHTLRHTALSRMIAAGYDDYTVMAISGHTSTRMLERTRIRPKQRKIGALDFPGVGRTRAERTSRIPGLGNGVGNANC